MPVTTFEDDSDCYQKRGKRRDVPGTLTTLVRLSCQQVTVYI